MSEVKRSSWDRLVAGLAHPIRALAWAIALGALLGPLGGASWVVVSWIGLMIGLLGGELAGRSRVRTPWLVLGSAAILLASVACRAILTTSSLVGTVLGPTHAIWVSFLLAIGLTVAALAALTRVLALRGPAFLAVELFVLGGSLAHAVASHRDGSIARPLWLSDLSWSFGVDPGAVLLAAGGGLTLLLAGLLLLGAERRKPTGGWLLLPLLAVVAWLAAGQIPALNPPDPESLFAEAGGEDPASPTETEDKEEGAPSDEEDEDQDGEGTPKDPSEEENDGQDGEQTQDQEEGPDGEDLSPEAPPSEGGEEGTEEGGAASQGEVPEGGASPEGEGEGTPAKTAPDPLEGGGGGGDAPVAVVLIDDDYVPPSGTWYLRQGVLSDFNGTRLVASDVPGTQDDILDHFAVAEEPLAYQAPLEHRTEVHGSVALLVEHPNPFGPEAPVTYLPRANPNPARFDRSFGFVSHALNASLSELVALGVGNPDWPDAVREQYLEVPEDPRYRELALQIRDEFVATLPEPIREDPFAQAVGITTWIGDNMQYSKAERHADADDPTADFLFGNRIGYCVHTAHASVYLWRELGIPARVATGYAVEEANRRGSVLIVKSGNAHAWSELYVTGVGWVPLDVAPAENLDPPAAPPDEDEGAMLGEMARSTPDQPAGPRPDYSWIWGWLGKLTGGTLSSLVLVLFLLHYGVKFWRRTRPLWARPATLSRVGFRTALDLLNEAGFVRGEEETREAFARRVNLPSLDRLTALHLRATLGGPLASDAKALSRSEWTGHLARLRVDLANSRPRWRRWLGLIDPTSVYRTR